MKINLEKISSSKEYFMKEQFKIFSIFTDFRAIFCIFGPTKKFFETYFIILLHIQLQEAISNQSAKSTSKNIEKWLRYWIFCKISLNQHCFGTVPNCGYLGYRIYFFEAFALKFWDVCCFGS